MNAAAPTKPRSPMARDVTPEAARAAARARWGKPRILRLDDLTPAQVEAVIAFANAFRESNEAVAR